MADPRLKKHGVFCPAIFWLLPILILISAGSNILVATIIVFQFQLGVNKIVTGHNADDIAETVIIKIHLYKIYKSPPTSSS